MAETLSANALLEEAVRFGIGVLFEPDYDDEGEENGWTITAVMRGEKWFEDQSGFPGERLASAYDLETAVAAAMKPLGELSERRNRQHQRAGS
jgi:hypothetical protein